MGHGFHGFPIYGPIEMVVYGRGLWKGDFPIKPPSMSMGIHRSVYGSWIPWIAWIPWPCAKIKGFSY